MVEDALTIPGLGRDLDEPDSGFRCLHLAEKRAEAAELVVPPVLEEPSGFGRNLPLIRVGQKSARRQRDADLIDDRSGVVLLLFGRKPLAFIEHKS